MTGAKNPILTTKGSGNLKRALSAIKTKEHIIILFQKLIPKNMEISE